MHVDNKEMRCGNLWKNGNLRDHFERKCARDPLRYALMPERTGIFHRLSPGCKQQIHSRKQNKIWWESA